MHVPSDSTYIYLDNKGYWHAVQSEYIERKALDELTQTKDVRASRCTEIRKLVELKCLMPLNRKLNDHNGYINLTNGMLAWKAASFIPTTKTIFPVFNYP